MVRIGRSFDELDKRVKQLNQSIKSTDATIRDLDKDLKLNPGSVDTVRKKYSLLEQNLQSSAKKLTTLKEKQAALNKDFQSGAISQDTYNRQLASTARSIDATEKQVEELTIALQKQNAAVRDAKFTNLTNGLNKAEEVANSFSKVALGVVTAITAITAAAIKTGDELSDNATHYGTSAENLQLWSNRLGMLAKDQEAYTSSLEKIGSIQSSITAGRGARYLTYLKELGLTQADVLGKSNGEVFDIIYEKLRSVTDATERATIAQGLLGDTGLEIAVIAGTAQEAINELDAALISNGIITTEQAMVADNAANQLLALKQQFQAVSVEMLTDLMPVFETVVNLIKTAVIPTLKSISGWIGSLTEGQQKAYLILLLIAILLPKIIAIAKVAVGLFKLITAATHAQTAATAGLNAVAGPWLILIMAITAAIIMLIYWLNKLAGAENDAVVSSQNLLGNLEGVEEQLSNMGSDLEVGGNVSYETSNHKTYDFNVAVEATGDTPISQENAEYIAENLESKIKTDLINNELGGIIR